MKTAKAIKVVIEIVPWWAFRYSLKWFEGENHMFTYCKDNAWITVTLGCFVMAIVISKNVPEGAAF